MLKKISIVAIMLFSVFMVKNAFNNSALPNAGFSGAPGESTCAASGCHTGVVQVNSNVVNFSFFPVNNPRPVSYQLNTVYNLIVNFPLVQPAVAGFLVTALDDNNNNVGTFQIVSTANTDTLTDLNTGRKYIGHKNATSTSAWIFRWLSPSVFMGKVTFYCAALGADGNQLATNDITYIDTIQFPAGGVSNILQAGFNVSQNSACTNEIVTFTSSSTGTITSYEWNFGLGATPPNATGIGPHNVAYSSGGNKTVFLKISDGTDSDSLSRNFTVNETPVANAGNDVTICSGDTTTLLATGNGDFSWSNFATTASIRVAPVTNTTFMVTVDNNGCTDTDEVRVFVSPKPVVNLSNQTLCAGASIVLDAGNIGASYMWSTLETTKTITINNGGTFSVTVTNANNCQGTGSATVTVANSLNVGLPDSIEICFGDAAILDAGNPGAMYSWSTNATTQAVSVSAQNTYKVTVTDANGCSGIDSVFLKVNPLPVITGNDTTICNGDSLVLDAGNPGADFLWNTSATTQSIQVAPGNFSTFSVTVTDANACSATKNFNVTVEGIRADDVIVCLGDTAVLNALGGTDFLWSTQETTATIKVFTLDTLSLILTGTVAGNCNAIDTVNIFPVSSLTPDFILPDSFCSNEIIDLNTMVSPTGGTFSGIGVTGTQLDVSQVPVGGPFTISYALLDSNNCGAVVTREFNVKLAATVSLSSLKPSYCSNEGIEQLVGTPQGGTFIGSGVSGNIFVPFFAGNGSQIIQYIFAAPNGCVSVDSDTVIVHEAPKVLFFMPQTLFCSQDDSVLLEALPQGGVFEGLGVSNSYFVPALSGAGGPFVISYTITDSNQCQSKAVNTVHVSATSPISFSNLRQNYCIDEGIVPLNALPQGGTFVGNGVSNNQLNVSSLGVGTDTLQYVFVNADNCVSNAALIINVNDTPSITLFDLTDEICTNETAIPLVALPSGGVFTGTGVVGGTVFDPSVAGAGGPYEITYSISDTNQCSNTASKNVFVNQSPDVTIEAIGPEFCATDFFNYPIVFTPQGGQLTGAGVVGTSFVPGIAGAGTHIIRYEFLSLNGCFESKDISVRVENCSGINDVFLSRIVAYPNPFQNSFSVTIESAYAGSLQLTLYSILGEKIFEQTYFNQNKIVVQPEKILPNGMYLLRITNEKNTATISLQKRN